MTAIRVHVTTSNIRTNPMQWFLAIRRRIVRAASLPGVNFGQEVAPHKRARAVRRRNRRFVGAIWHDRMLARDKSTVGRGHEVPISFPVDGWDRQSDTAHRVHGSAQQEIHRRGISPARFITELRSVSQDERYPVAWLCCHPVSKGYKTGRGTIGVSAMEWRRQKLDQYMDRLREVIAAAHADGYTVVYGGDMNFPGMPRLHPDEVVLAHKGLDHLRVVPAEGYKITNVDNYSIARNVAMDHPILHASFDLRRAA